MQVRLIWFTAAAAALWCLGTPTRQARATPMEELAEAEEAFFRGDYQKSIPLCNYLIYPSIRLARKNDIVKARILLGAAYFETQEVTAARRELEAALRMDDQFIMTEAVFSPEAIQFFNAIKAELMENARQSAELRAAVEERERLQRALENMIVIERRPYFINFVPFGAGQFQNGHNRKGIVLVASEGSLCTASAALWLVQVGKYGFNGQVPLEEIQSVRTMQKWQVGAGVACVVLMGAGIADALIHYKSETRLPADESLLPEHLKPRNRAPRGAGSMHITPTAGSTGAGVALSWQF